MDGSFNRTPRNDVVVLAQLRDELVQVESGEVVAGAAEDAVAARRLVGNGLQVLGVVEQSGRVDVVLESILYADPLAPCFKPDAHFKQTRTDVTRVFASGTASTVISLGFSGAAPQFSTSGCQSLGKTWGPRRCSRDAGRTACT